MKNLRVLCEFSVKEIMPKQKLFDSSRQALSILSAFLAVPMGAYAQSANKIESTNFCRYAQETASVEGALLKWPNVIANVDNGNQFVDGSRTTSLELQFSPIRFYQGMLIEREADAKCRQYYARVRLENALAHIDGIDNGESHTARLKVLTWALPQATQQLDRYRELLESRAVTAVELYEMQSRIDELRHAISESESAIQRYKMFPSMKKITLESLITAYRKSDEELENISQDRTAAGAWSLNVMAGAERYYGNVSRTSFVSGATLGFNFGSFFQGSSYERASEYRAKWVNGDGETLVGRVRNLKLELTLKLKMERERLTEVTVLEKDLRGRVGPVMNAQSSRARAFNSRFWLRWVFYRAEKAYLDSHVASLSTFLESQQAIESRQ